MKNTIKTIARKAREKAEELFIRAQLKKCTLNEVLADERGEEHSVARVVGVIIVVVLGLLLIAGFSGLFTNDLMPQIKDSTKKLFDFAP